MPEYVSAHRRKQIEQRTAGRTPTVKKREPQRRSAVSKRAEELVAEGLSLADASARAQWEVNETRYQEPTLTSWATTQLAELARERAFEHGESPAEASRIVAKRNKALVDLAYSSEFGHLPLSKAKAELAKMAGSVSKNADELTRPEDLQRVVAMLKAVE